MDRFLLISPHFPPSSKIGAKRALNLVRHLPPLGWEPVVLCCPTRQGSERLGQNGLVPAKLAVYPEFTSRLGRTLRGRGDAVERLPEIGAAASDAVVRSVPWIDAIRRSEITPLDQYMWDIPFLMGKIERIARREGIQAIVVNADPWSGLVVGVAAARRLGLPVIADLRDPWALHPRRRRQRPAITHAAVSFLERRLLGRVDRIVLNTERCAAAYRKHYAGYIDEERITFVRNAFDEPLYYQPQPAARKDFEIHYFGTVGSGRDPSDFYEGLARFIRDFEPAPDDVRLVFHGDAGPAADARVRKLGLRERVEARPACSFRDAVRRLHGAAVLLLLEGPERSLQLPAKLYDYLAAGRPILAVGAHEELADILARTGAGVSTRGEEGPDAVARHLRELYRKRNRPFALDEKAIDEFRADAQAMRFRELLDDVVRGAAE